MARFPLAEVEVAALAEAVANGLTANAPGFPDAPVLPVDLETLINGYRTAVGDVEAANAAAEAATDAKNAAFEDMADAVKKDLRYAENLYDYDDTKMKLIGWAGRAENTPLQVPGQTRSLDVLKQGAGWIVLDWKKPSDGGNVQNYKIMRRQRPEGPWKEASSAVVSEATLVEQPTGKELEYRIIGVNKAGEGEPSDTEMVVL